MKQAILFDLDNCLAAANEAGPALLQPVFEAIMAANGGALAPDALERAKADLWLRPFDIVARKHAFPDAIHAAGWEAYRALRITTPLTGYADLAVLRELDARCFLVTSGFRRLQESKVDALGIRGFFEGVYIDAIDEPGRLGKRRIFENILQEHRLSLAQAMVVGDDPESEIEAGNRLGIMTVQILRPGVVRSEWATCHIASLSALPALLRSRSTRV